jgi:hypothetical protein
MTEGITVPLEDYKRAIEWGKALEDEKVGNMDPEQKAAYFQSRAVVAEDALTAVTLRSATAELAVKYPAAIAEEITGKTVSEIEASFKASETRNKAAYDRAFDKVKGEFEEQVKNADANLQAKVKEVFDAWGKPRVPEAEDTKIETDKQGREGLSQSGVTIAGEVRPAPSTIEEAIAAKIPATFSRMFGGRPVGASQ